MSTMFRWMRAVPTLGIVAVLAACTVIGGSGGSATPPGGYSTCPPPSAFEDREDVLQDLTAALQHHDGSGFRTLAGTPAAEQAMTMWWRNVSAIGFTTGAIRPARDLNNDEPQPFLLDIGLHNSLDPSDEQKLPQAPATRYKVTTRRAGPGCGHVVITDWQPMSNAPWDAPTRLFVVHTPHTVVAGDPALRPQIRRVARIAEQAATWDFTFFRAEHKRVYVEQKGFVTFVAATNKQAETWLRPPGAPKPKGWVGDAAFADGYEFPMPGADVWPGVRGRQTSSSPIGGSRIVITPAGVRDNDVNLEGTLVHEYVHAIFRVNDVWSWGGGPRLPAATAEGAARWIEALYDSDPTADPTDPQADFHSLRILQPVVASRPFNGRIPTDQQIYGAAADANYYYDLSATAFSYLAAAYGAGFAIQSIAEAYLAEGGPFSGVVGSIKHGTLRFERPADVQRRWASWVRSGFPDTPPR